MRLSLFAGTALISGLIGSAVWAQAPAPAAGVGQLEEVVVTAQRRSENLQKAAVAVAVVSGDTLSRANVSTAGQLSQLIPSLSVQNSGGANATFFIRGVGNFTVNGYSDPATAFNYDGVYVGRPTSTSGSFYDLERIEVLKGPQGTLYGRNATAGAINIIPVKPKPGVFGGYVNAGFGNYSAAMVEGAVNAPIGQASALRLSGNLVQHDGYLSDGTSDQKDRAFRAQFLTHLNDDLTVRISADWSHQGGRGVGSSYAVNFPYIPAAGRFLVLPSGLNSGTGLFDPRSAAFRQTVFAGLPGRTLGRLDSNTYLDDTFYGANAEIEWKSALGTLTVIPAVRKAQLDNRFAVPAFIGYIQEDDRQASLEARFNGNRVGMFDYILGAYYFDETNKGNYTFSQDALAAYQEFKSGTESYAVFGRLTAHLSDRLRLVGGLRYTDDQKSFSGTADVLTVVCTVRVNGVPSCPTAPVLPVTDSLSQLPFAVPGANGPPVPAGASGAIITRATTVVGRGQNSDRVTSHAGVEFDLGPQSLLYASFENGYRSGGFSLSYGYETFQPEYIDAYTLGSKNRLFGGRLQLNAEAFYWKYRNQQINHAGIDLRGNQGQFTENVGRSVNKGVELEARFLAAPKTLLSANIQYLDAKYDSFIYKVPVGASPPYVGCPTAISAANPAVRNVDCSGKPAYNAPKWTANLGVQQTVSVGGFDVILAADTQYRSSRVVGFEYAPYDVAPASWTSNAQATLQRSDNDRWSISAYVQNIEDKRTLVNGTVFGIGSLGTQVVSAPRTYGLRVGAKF